MRIFMKTLLMTLLWVLLFTGCRQLTPEPIPSGSAHNHAAMSCKCGGVCKCIDCKCKNCQCVAYCKNGGNALLSMMEVMMVAMDKAQSDASVEADFLNQMLAHHQGAIDMAKYEIANGKNPEMIQLAKSIFAEQQTEIAKMRWLLAHCGKTPVSADYRTAMTKTMNDMMAVAPASGIKYNSVDQAFAAIMLPHHQAAIDMALVLLKYGKDPQIANLAAKIITDQEVEIEQMQAFLKSAQTE